MFSTSGDVQYIGRRSMHRRMFNASGGVQYIGGIPWVHRGDSMSTSGDIMNTSGGVQYIGGYHDACGAISWCMWGDIMIHVGGYHEYIGGISWVHRGDIMSTSGGYHEYIGGCSVDQGDIMMHVGEQVGKNLSISIENPHVLMVSPHMHHDIPLMYSWYPPDVSWYPPDVLMVSPDVLMVSPRCTHDIPRSTHSIPWCTEHTLYRVLMVSSKNVKVSQNVVLDDFYRKLYWSSPSEQIIDFVNWCYGCMERTPYYKILSFSLEKNNRSTWHKWLMRQD